MKVTIPVTFEIEGKDPERDLKETVARAAAEQVLEGGFVMIVEDYNDPGDRINVWVDGYGSCEVSEPTTPEPRADKGEGDVAAALFTFMGWLTTRDEPEIISKHHNSDPFPRLIEKFCKHNGVPDPDMKSNRYEHPTNGRRIEEGSW